MTHSDRSPEAVLRERAERLARPIDDESHEGTRALLVLGRADETFAVDAHRVDGIFRMKALTPLPGAPQHVAGVTAWRGRLLTILDADVLLQAGRTGLDDRVWGVALSAGDASFGLLAGRIHGVRDVPQSSIKQPEEKASSIVAGTTSDAVLVLDVDALATVRPHKEK